MRSQDNKRSTRSHNSKKDKQHDDKKKEDKRINNDFQNTTQKKFEQH